MVLASFTYLVLLTRKIEEKERYSRIGNKFFTLVQKYGELATVTDEYYALRDRVEQKCFREILGTVYEVDIVIRFRVLYIRSGTE